MEFEDVTPRLFAYNAWANREEIAALRTTRSPERALSILAHIIGAERLWLGRIEGAPPTAVWPKLTIDECAQAIEELAGEWARIVPAIDPTTSVEYTNSKGERWTSTAGDILTHVAMHGAYHRGQIALLVRDGGDTPAYTDFIHCVRSGFVV
jgi:uncharacterized damage-inducible protein DinB